MRSECEQWDRLQRFVWTEDLIVAHSCHLSLSAPFAVSGGITNLGRRVFIRDLLSIEALLPIYYL